MAYLGTNTTVIQKPRILINTGVDLVTNICRIEVINKLIICEKMKLSRYFTISLILFFSFSFTCFAQGNWKEFTKDNDPSTPRGTANTTFEDNQNNFWVGTNMGLFMFNGSKWKRFKKKDGLKGVNVTKFVQDSKGTIWIGTNKGLSTYKDGKLTAKKQRIKLSLKLSEMTNTFPINYISNIYKDSKENLWFGTGLKRSTPFLYSTGILVKYDGENCIYMNKTKMNGHPIIDIKEDNDGYMWVASGWECIDCTGRVYTGHLAKYKDGKWESYIDQIPYSGDWIINKIYKDKSGNLWFSAISNNNAGCVIKYDGKEMRFFTKNNGLLNYVNIYFEDSNGVLWLGGQRGLAYSTNDKFRFLRNISNEIIDLSVKTIREDSKKNIWVGTSRGIYVYTSEGSWKQFNIENGLSGDSNNTLRIREDFEGKMWVLNRGKRVKYYISKINPDDWSVETISPDNFIEHMPYVMVETSNKDMWFIANGHVLKYSE